MKKTIIKPRNFTPIHWNELVEYRELFWSLAYRDFRVRYAQTTMGLLWALIQPIISILILHVVFGKFCSSGNRRAATRFIHILWNDLLDLFLLCINQHR